MDRTNVHAHVCRSLFPLDALVVPLQVGAAQVGEHDLESRTDMPSNECRVVNTRSCARCFGRRVPQLYYLKSWCCVQCVSNVASQGFETVERCSINNIKHSNAPFESVYAFERAVRTMTAIRTQRSKQRIYSHDAF